MALTTKQVKIKYSSAGSAAANTSGNGDIIFDGANKKIYARGIEFNGNNTTYSNCSSTAAGIVPASTSDNNGKYLKIVDGSLAWSSVDVSIDESNLMHKNKKETVTGTKVFKDCHLNFLNADGDASIDFKINNDGVLTIKGPLDNYIKFYQTNQISTLANYLSIQASDTAFTSTNFTLTSSGKISLNESSDTFIHLRDDEIDMRSGSDAKILAQGKITFDSSGDFSLRSYGDERIKLSESYTTLWHGANSIKINDDEIELSSNTGIIQVSDDQVKLRMSEKSNLQVRDSSIVFVSQDLYWIKKDSTGHDIECVHLGAGGADTSCLPLSGGKMTGRIYWDSTYSNSAGAIRAYNGSGVIGTLADSTAAVHGVSNTGYGGYFKTNNTSTYALYSDGAFFCTTNAYASAFMQSSDIRYKNIEEYIDLSTAEISTLPVFDFKWKNVKDSDVYTGTSAQAVQEILPNLVREDKKSEKLTLDYATLGTVIGIVCAKEIEALKERINELEDKIR